MGFFEQGDDLRMMLEERVRLSRRRCRRLHLFDGWFDCCKSVYGRDLNLAVGVYDARKGAAFMTSGDKKVAAVFEAGL